ncbi:MAG: HAD family phosphatase [Lachnospiraceae bacterium]|nr:HAD family phosphatase [Lachnospiraceae bacterium]
MIKNIIFDIGRVLIDFDPDAYMKSYGFSRDKEKILRDATFGSPFWQELDRGIMTIEQIQDGFTSLVQPEYREELLQVFDQSFRTVRKRENAIPWIRSLQEQGFETYYLSNYSWWMLERTRDALDFLPLMRGGLFSCEVGQIKPEPEIFQTFLARFPEVRPEESVFFDDVPANIKAACAIGIHGIVFQNQEQAMKDLEELLLSLK